MSAVATAHELPISEPTGPPERPSPVRDVSSDELHELHLASSTPARRPPRGPITLDRDEQGCVIVSDLYGAVYGFGASEAEALHDFYRALDDHFSYLRAHLHELHPRLERQLVELQRLFPDRWMPYKLRELRRVLTNKLGLELDATADHPTFTFWHDGRVVARTHISHGSGKDVSDGVVSAMARQLGVTGLELRRSIDCEISDEAFASLVIANAKRS